MTAITRILSDIQRGDPAAAGELLPLIYQELRQLASSKMARERPGHTIQATALVHEAFLRLTDVEQPQDWNGRAHFFAAAAEAMRRILIENARQKKSLKRGGNLRRQCLHADLPVFDESKPIDDLLALDEALGRLADKDPVTADLVKLRYFAGLTLPQAAQILGISHNTADKYWAYAKAFLLQQLTRGTDHP
jgi:RNA polymerase sigma factor (TIGR02999 family)